MLLSEMVEQKEIRFLMKCCLRSLDDNWHRAEDAVQETLMRIVRSRTEVASRAQGYGFLRSAARFACLHLLRGLQRHRRRDRATERLDYVTETPADIAERADHVEATHSLVQRTLDPMTAQCVLRHVDGRTFEELGADFGLSRSAVHARVQRGIANLERRLPRPD